MRGRAAAPRRAPRALPGTRNKARIFSRNAADILGDPDMRWWPNFEIWEEEEPADKAYDYARRFNLTRRAAY